MTKTAIAILNWNGKSFLAKFLPALIENSNIPETEIWVIDNNSNDDSIVFLKETFPQIKLVLLDKNYGFTGGYNRGLKAIEAEYYLLLNSDIEVPKNWLTPLLELMENDKNIGICGPKLNSFSEKNSFEYAGASGGFLDKYGYPFCRGRIFENIEKDFNQYDDKIECFWISGAALMIRSELFNKLGGFDDDFFAHQEEIDLCWRVQNSGFKVVCEPKSYVFHVGGGTLPKTNSQKTFLNFRNSLYLICKNVPKLNRIRILWIRFFLDGIAAIRMLFQGNFSDYVAVNKAYLHFWGNLFKMKNKRKQFKSKAPKFLSGYYKRSIVFQNYIRQKNKFSDLKFE